MREEASLVAASILMAFACLQATLVGIFLAESWLLPVVGTLTAVVLTIALAKYRDGSEPVAGAESGRQNSQMTETDSTGGIAAE